MNRKAALKQHLDHGPRGVSIATAIFSGRAPVFSMIQPHNSASPMPPRRELTLANHPAAAVEKANQMLLARPVDAGIPFEVIRHMNLSHWVCGSPATFGRSLYWRSRRKPPTGPLSRPLRRGTCLSRCSQHRKDLVAHGGSTRPTSYKMSTHCWGAMKGTGRGPLRSNGKVRGG